MKRVFATLAAAGALFAGIVPIALAQNGQERAAASECVLSPDGYRCM